MRHGDERGGTRSYDTHLVLIKVSDDHSNKQRQSNHAAQEHKDVDVDTVDLQGEREREERLMTHWSSPLRRRR